MARVVKRESGKRNLKSVVEGNISEKRKAIFENVENIKPETKTEINEILDKDDTPAISKIRQTEKIINKDPQLSQEQKKDLFKRIQDLFKERFSLNDCPADPEELREEAVFLSELAAASYILIAQRSKIIRDKELYLSWGYNDFKEWVGKELKVSRASVYRYIDLIEYFGVSALRHVEHPSKLIPGTQLLKSPKIQDHKKEEIKERLLQDSAKKSFREMEKEAAELKEELGLSKTENPEDKDLDKKLIKRNIAQIYDIHRHKNRPLILEIYSQEEADYLISKLKEFRTNNQ